LNERERERGREEHRSYRNAIDGVLQLDDTLKTFEGSLAFVDVGYHLLNLVHGL